ncbi:hypothetical protein [Marinoscillum furvescens]|uniref:Outer membrane protein with beta-barrel domain n=1 Tax=Marinoscillum furvescens DSM 4134 TaxID=1122208 RepID=A0A3D9L0N6_MARFU|nr:hypothetical protein [Marinoscillum furvescens]RED97004.1 hypothetical protein C7460_11352 [Marinoscillum furvescens DSM 4134]
MKTVISLFALMMIASTYIQAQGFQATTYIERTHVSPKVGTAVGYEFNQTQIEVGGFFQQSTVELQAEAGRPLTSEMNFIGAYFAYPLLNKGIASLKLNVRTGVSNGENFSITPSILANVKPLRNISLGAGVGTRSLRPTFMASIRFHLNPGNRGGSFLAINTTNSQ